MFLILTVVWFHCYVHIKTYLMVYVVHYIPVINLFLTNVESDPKVYWNIFLRVYLGRRANWRAVVGLRGAGRVEAQSRFFHRHTRALGNWKMPENKAPP